MKFKVKENGFDEIRKKMILQKAPIILIAIFAGLAISHFNTNGQSTDVNILPFMIPIVIGSSFLGFIIAIKRQKKVFDSYELTIDEEKIIRRQNLTPDIEVSFSEVQKIIKNKNGTLTIKGVNSNNSIEVPSQIENLIELEAMLSKVTEITTHDKQSPQQKQTWVLALLTVALMMIVYLAKNKILVGVSGVVLTLGLTYSLIATQRSKHVDKITKAAIWLILFVLPSIIAVTYFKVFGL